MQEIPDTITFLEYLGAMAAFSALASGVAYYSIEKYIMPTIDAFSEYYGLPQTRKGGLIRTVGKKIRDTKVF